MGGLYTPACKLSAGSRPSRPSGCAPVSRPEPPSSVMAGNGFSALRDSRVSPTSATSPALIAPPPDTPPSAGQTPCSPMSKTASWPPTAPSRPNICRATSAPSPGASTAASSSKQSTSDWPSPPRRPRQCPIASSNWLRLDGKRVTVYETSAIVGYIDDAFDGPRLTPADPRQRARMNQWISAVNGYYYPYLI